MASKATLPFEQLLDWLEGRLPAEVAAEVERQVATAEPDVQGQVNWLRAFGALSRAVSLAKPPEAVRTQLTEQFARYAEAKEQPSLFQRLVAALAFDSAHQPAAVGLRSGDVEQARQFVYTTARADIALHIQQRKHDQRLDLIGQILPNDATLTLDTFCVQLLQGTEEAAITMADDLGEFMFQAINPGVYQLAISGDTMDIQLPTIALTS
ncbi:MAG: hypothetical protein U0350_28475 [Caldilineaceae bacterium]